MSERLRCSRCGETHPASAFDKHAKKKNGRDSWCRACKRFNTKRWAANNPGRDSARAMKWNAANPDKKRRSHRRHALKVYGVTPETVDLMADMQGGCCAICRLPKKLYVDHCHRTGLVRGLLCSECNLALGKFKDSVDALRRAAAYVEKFNVS